MSHEHDFLVRARAHRATWMARPDDWAWARPDGALQGFGLNWRTASGVGYANLLWLALDMETPPKVYNARDNGLYTLLSIYAHAMTLDSLPLVDQAGSLTLAQFRNELETGRFNDPSSGHASIAPLLALFATRRLEYAHG